MDGWEGFTHLNLVQVLKHYMFIITTHVLTLYAQLKANMAEGKCSGVRLYLTDAADVVIVQVYVYKVFLFFHAASAKQTEVYK